MSTHSPHTVLVTALAICLAAALAVANANRERSGGLPPAAYGLQDAFSSR
jgi:hypothetical protein